MFNRKQKEIDELNARCVDLAQQLRDAKLENKQLKEIRLLEVRNNTKILKQNSKKTKLLKEAKELAESNYYGNPQKRLDKIKELIETGINN